MYGAAFFSLFFFLIYLIISMMKQSKIKYKTVLKGETPRSDSIQTVTGEEQKTSKNSFVSNDATRPKPEGCLVAEVHKGEKKP